MEFDCVVGNPPYGLRTGNIHMKILKTTLPRCSDRVVFIMPGKPLVEETEWNDMLRKAVCTGVEVMLEDIFPTTDMEATAIYRIERNGVEYCRRLDVDKTVYGMIDSDAHRLFMDKMPGGLKMYAHVHGNTPAEVRAAKRRITDNGWYLNVNRVRGNYDGQWLSGYLQGVPVLDMENEVDFITGKMYNILYCPTRRYGENLKKLLNGVVLRYGLWVTQSNRFILDRQFRYFPLVDYSVIDTDEELLHACGFDSVEVRVLMDYLGGFDFSKKRNDMIRNQKTCI